MSSCGCLRCLIGEEDAERESKLKKEGVADWKEIEGHSKMDEIEDSFRDPLPFHLDFADFLKSEQDRIGVGPALGVDGEIGLGSFMSPDSVRRLLCKQTPKDIFSIVIDMSFNLRNRNRRDRCYVNVGASRELARVVC
jgi:hypothetical protein